MLSNRIEVMPSVENDELSLLQEDTRVAITASQNATMNETVRVCEVASNSGLQPIAHLAARQISDHKHLDELMNELMSIGVNDVFVIGGDKEEEIGEFDQTMDILPYIDNKYSVRIGVGGYPEKHHIIQDTQSLTQQKLEYADYVSTQICYDADKIVEWSSKMNSDVLVGIPGVIPEGRLRSISDRIGVGSSMQVLQRESEELYNPESLLKSVLESEPNNLTGFHINTFNMVQSTINWIENSDVIEIDSFR